MDIGCVMIELKPNSLERVRAWANFLLENKDGALQTLKAEGVTVENFFLFQQGDKDFLIGYMRAKSLAHAQQVVKNSLSEIDAYHQQFKKDAWAKVMRTELLVDLSRLDKEEEQA